MYEFLRDIAIMDFAAQKNPVEADSNTPVQDMPRINSYIRPIILQVVRESRIPRYAAIKTIGHHGPSARRSHAAVANL